MSSWSGLGGDTRSSLSERSRRGIRADSGTAVRRTDRSLPEGSFQLGAQPVVTGRDGVRANFAGFFSLGLFTSLTHEMLEVFDLTEILIYRALVTYLREGASPLTVPYMNAITYRDGLFDRYEVFIDTAPLFAPPQ